MVIVPGVDAQGGRAHRAWPRFVALVLGIALLAAACSRSGFQYVENRDEGLFLKLPEKWAVYQLEETENPPQTVEDLLAQPLAAEADSWQIVFDSSPDPSASNITSAGVPEYVLGLAEVQPISLGERDTISMASLRSLILRGTTDPVIESREADSSIELLLDSDFVSDSLRGNRVIFRNTVSDNVEVTFDQVVLVDAATSRYYRLVVFCESGCYSANKTLIDEIVESLTVED